MSGSRIFALILIAAGIFALIYHGFSYTRDEHEAKIGSVELSIRHETTLDIPTWLSAGAVVAGVVLLLTGGRKR